MKAIPMMIPHALICIDIKWIGFRAGAAYYDIQKDEFRPAFLDIVVWQKWRFSFEIGRFSFLSR